MSTGLTAKRAKPIPTVEQISVAQAHECLRDVMLRIAKAYSVGMSERDERAVISRLYADKRRFELIIESHET